MTDKIIVRVNQDDKESFKAFCDSIGVPMSMAIKMFNKATLREGRIPFEVEEDPFYSESNKALLRKSIEELEKTGGTIHNID